jgi:hypothetical protein
MTTQLPQAARSSVITLDQLRAAPELCERDSRELSESGGSCGAWWKAQVAYLFEEALVGPTGFQDLAGAPAVASFGPGAQAMASGRDGWPGLLPHRPTMLATNRGPIRCSKRRDISPVARHGGEQRGRVAVWLVCGRSRRQ